MMKFKKLVIISHTNHYKNDHGVVVGWGPTVNEINYLADYFEEIIHVACLFDGIAPLSSNAYLKDNIRFIPIPPFGGHNVIKKAGILFKMPKILNIISNEINGATHVQLRLPTGIGVLLLPYFAWFKKRNFTFWVKYAGNWAENNPPLGYRFQRWFLVKNFAKCKVTINGFWPNQPSHCISFENPCLTSDQIKYGSIIAKSKIFNKPFRFVFVGRLEDAKGVQRIIDAFNELDFDAIESLDFIGDGPLKEHYKIESNYLKEKVKFHGFLQTEKVHGILGKAHFLLLPSTASEGFPKVIAEAACYGTVPIVSNAGSIAHYISKKSGIVCDGRELDLAFTQALLKSINNDIETLEDLSTEVLYVAEMFTFENYFRKLKIHILVDK